MYFRPSVAFVALTVCLASARLVVAVTEDAAGDLEPLSQARAAEILARREEIADSIVKQLVSGKKSRSSLALEDARDAMAPASEWRWYSRDHGILLAIPVREQLGIGSKVRGERDLADIARRLLHQEGWANPPVQVVFIEPAPPSPVRPCSGCHTVPDTIMTSPCGCR